MKLGLTVKKSHFHTKNTYKLLDTQQVYWSSYL